MTIMEPLPEIDLSNFFGIEAGVGATDSGFKLKKADVLKIICVLIVLALILFARRR
jgi:hypothetical protein